MTIQAPWDATDISDMATQLARAPVQAPDDKRARNTADAYAHKPVASPIAARVQQLPPDETGTPELLVQGGSGMIFLRHTETGWHARFFGVPGVGGKSELPLPCPIDTKLAQVIERLQGRFPACWLLVSP